MTKTIILLSGSPSGKNSFMRTAKEEYWIKNVNVKTMVSKAISQLGVYGERGQEEWNEAISDILRTLNNHFSYEEMKIREAIAEFQMSYDVPHVADGKLFGSNILIIHGISSYSLVNTLKEDFSAFKIHIATSDYNAGMGNNDLILYEDKDDFQESIKNTLKVLTKEVA